MKCLKCNRDYTKLKYIYTSFVNPHEDKVSERHLCLHCFAMIEVVYKQIRVLQAIRICPYPKP